MRRDRLEMFADLLRVASHYPGCSMCHVAELARWKQSSGIRAIRFLAEKGLLHVVKKSGGYGSVVSVTVEGFDWLHRFESLTHALFEGRKDGSYGELKLLSCCQHSLSEKFGCRSVVARLGLGQGSAVEGCGAPHVKNSVEG